MQGYFKYIVLCTMLLTSTLSVLAQNIKLTGTVMDTEDFPLIGATVTTASDKMVGTVTDYDGNFTLEVPKNTKNIKISYLGYKTQILEIKGQRHFNVVLKSNNVEIDEVVVVGYGSMKKSDITGAVTSVALDDVEARSATSIQNLLQGRAPGVQVQAGDGAPGSAVNIKIRGTSSLTGSSEPLYVVDGIVMNSASADVSMKGAGSNNNFTQGQNGLTGINPQDIASIEILKDASATAIYGSLGANGVVLITTKEGSGDRTSVQYSGSATSSIMANKRDLLGLEDYAEFKTEFDRAKSGDPTRTYNIDGLKEIDWQDEITRMAISHSHRMSVSGKNDNTNYYISGGFMDNEGIVKGTQVQQADIRLNIDHALTKYIKFGTKSAFTYSKNTMVQGSDTRGNSNSGLIRQALSFKPFDPTIGDITDDELLDEEGNPVSDPRAWFTDYDDTSREYRALSSMYLNVNILKWLSMRSTVGIDYRDKNREIFFGTDLFQGAKNNGVVESASIKLLSVNFDHMFNVNKRFKKHQIQATAGISISTKQQHTGGLATSQFNGNLAFGDQGFIYGSKDEAMRNNFVKTNSFSALARVIYSYADRYVLTSTFRTDGTSKFAPGNKFSNFPSVAFAYRLSEEKFMKQIEQISNVKLRLGWGMVGNQGISPYQTMMTFGSSQYQNPNGGYDVATFRNILPNPDLKWETTTTYNVGLDLGFFDSRLNMSADLYYKESTDLLQKINISSIAGFNSMFVNRGSIENKGLELSLDGQIVQTKDFTLSMGGSFTLNRNKISDIGLPEGEFGNHRFKAMTGDVIGAGNYLKDYVNIFIEGRPVALYFGTKVDGILQQSDVDRMMANGTLPTYKDVPLRAGDPNYVDINKDGVIDSRDETIIGDPNPDFSYGLTLDMTYKNFYLNTVFNGVYGNEIVNANRLQEEDFLQGNNNITQSSFDNYWKEDRPSTTYPRLLYNGNNENFTSMIIEDGSFFRMALLTLGYNFNIKQNKAIRGVGLNFTARNLFTLTSYSGYDPEVSTFANNPMRVGIDWASYPNNRSFTLGVTLDF